MSVGITPNSSGKIFIYFFDFNRYMLDRHDILTTSNASVYREKFSSEINNGTQMPLFSMSVWYSHLSDNFKNRSFLHLK